MDTKYQTRELAVFLAGLITLIAVITMATSTRAAGEPLTGTPAAAVEEAGAGPQSESASVPALSRISFSTRVGYAIALNSQCPGTTCADGSCTAVTFAGSVNVASLGASTMAGCVVFDTDTAQVNGTDGTCDASSGLLTLTSVKTTNAVSLGLGGQVCEVPAGSLLAAIEMNLGYVVNGGAGKFASAVGQGNLTGSLVLTSGTAGNGILTLTGNLAQH